ncbi:LOW QUALITY PROTEIN: myosin regulatory light chain 2, atrial isoform [Phoenicopterus ruber ruber]
MSPRSRWHLQWPLSPPGARLSPVPGATWPCHHVPPPGKRNVNDEELEELLQEGKGPVSFTVFLTLFGEQLNRTDPQESILNVKLFDPAGTGTVEQTFAVTPGDASGSIDCKSLCHIIAQGTRRRSEGTAGPLPPQPLAPAK